MIHKMKKVGIPAPVGKTVSMCPGGTVGGRRAVATEAHVPASYMALASAARDKR